MSEWKECKLGEISYKIGSGATPTGGENSYKSEGISLIRSQNVYDFNFSSDGLAYIDEEQAYNLRNVEVLEDDILINITGESVTRCCIVPKQILPARVNQHVSIIRPIKEKSDYKFIFYYLQSIKPELNSMAEIGCTRRALTKVMLENLDITLPHITEQTAIASILSNLDDKIDLLHCQNKTLETMAETFFRQWFVEEADEGWEDRKLGDICSLITDGKHGDCKDEDNSGYYFVSVKDVVDGKIDYSGARQISKSDFEETHRRTNFAPGDTIITNSGTIGRMAIATDIPETRKTTFQKSVAILKPKEGVTTSYYLYCLLKSNIKMIIELAGGTTQSNLLLGDLRNFEINYPSFCKVNQFEEQVKSLFEKKFINQSQIHTLEELRNVLLPKLMSREVRVEL